MEHYWTRCQSFLNIRVAFCEYPSLFARAGFYLQNGDQNMSLHEWVHHCQELQSDRNGPPTVRDDYFVLKEDEFCSHKTFQTVFQRIKSFHDRQYGDIQDPRELAKSVLFYTGRGDVVRYYSCGGEFQKWNILDEPWHEHARMYPDCEHVALNKGSSYIEDIKDPNQRTFGRKTDGNINLKGAEAIRYLIAMGFDSRNVREAVNKWEHNNPDEPFTSDSLQLILSSGSNCIKLRNICPDKSQGEAYEGRTGFGQCSHRFLQDYNLSLKCDNLTQQTKEMQKHEQFLKNELRNSQDREKQLREKNDSLERRISCKSCLANAMNDVRIVLLPCGHMVCESCFPCLQKCGICRADIKGSMKTYLS